MWSWSQFFLQLFTSLVIMVGIFYWAFVKRLPNMVQDKLKQDRGFEFDKQLQTDNYYRSNGQSDMQKLIIDWAKLLIDQNGAAALQSNGLIDLQSRTIGYASEGTIEIVGDLMQTLYSNNKEDGDNDMDPYKFVAYIAVISSELKMDFTGQSFRPIDLIRMKINDMTTDGSEKYQENIDKILKK